MTITVRDRVEHGHTVWCVTAALAGLEPLWRVVSRHDTEHAARAAAALLTVTSRAAAA